MQLLLTSIIAVLLAAQSTAAAPVYRKCEDFLFARRSSDALEGLKAGEKLYGEVPDDFEIDKQTSTDLQLDRVASVFDSYFYSDFGRARFRYMLSHPLLDADEIKRKQENLKFIIDNPEKFAGIREFLSSMKRKRSDILQEFTQLQREEHGIRNEWLRAAITYSMLAAPALAHYLPIDIGNWIQWIVAGRGGSLGWQNAMKNVEPKRKALLRYRDEMIVAKHMADAADHFADGSVDELKDALNILYEGEKQNFADKNWVKLNSVLNSTDRDLVIESGIDPTLPLKPGDEGLLKLNLKLRLMEKNWSVRVPYTKVTLPLPNPTTIGDKLHLTNFSLIKLQGQVVEAKNELSKVFSAMAELEVMIAMADFYNANKDKMPLEFFEILDLEAPTELRVDEAHHPVIAVTKGSESIGNKIRLGLNSEGKGFTVILSQMGGGASTYQETAALCQIFAQNGWFSFGRRGRITPGLLATALDLRPNLGPNDKFRHVEAQRYAMILRMHQQFPHSFTYLSNPFTDAGENAGVAVRESVLIELIHLKTVGMMSTRSRSLLEEIKGNRDLSKIFVDQRRVSDFNYDEHAQSLLPDVYYEELKDDGLPQSVTNRSHQIYHRMAKKGFALPQNQYSE